ncbi:hypothetical protein VPHD51_0168 [Vibrio phage D51]
MMYRTFILRLLLALIMNAVTIGNLPIAVMDAMLLTPGLVILTSFLFSAGYYWLTGVIIRD